MPAAVVIAGAASIAGGVSAGFSLAAGFTLANVAAGAMIVGGAMTVIGGLTGNEDLVKVGGVISLAGGIGTLVNGMLGAAGGVDAATAGETLSADMSGLADMSAAETAQIARGQALANAMDAGLTGQAATKAATEAIKASSLAPEVMSAATKTAIKPISAESLEIPDVGSQGEGGGLTGALDKLSRYDKLLDIGGGIADYMDRQDSLDIYRERNDLARQKFEDQRANANAKFDVNVKPTEFRPGMLYGNQPARPLPIRSAK